MQALLASAWGVPVGPGHPILKTAIQQDQEEEEEDITQGQELTLRVPHQPQEVLLNVALHALREVMRVIALANLPEL